MIDSHSYPLILVRHEETNSISFYTNCQKIFFYSGLGFLLRVCHLQYMAPNPAAPIFEKAGHPFVVLRRRLTGIFFFFGHKKGRRCMWQVVMYLHCSVIIQHFVCFWYLEAKVDYRRCRVATKRVRRSSSRSRYNGISVVHYQFMISGGWFPQLQ